MAKNPKPLREWAIKRSEDEWWRTEVWDRGRWEYERRERAKIEEKRLKEYEAAKAASQRAAKERAERARQMMIFDAILQLIKEKKLTPTAAYINSVTDREQKRKLIEAICLGNV